MKAALILTSGLSLGSLATHWDAVQGYAIALQAVAGVLLENGRALWAALWLLGGGVAG